MSRVVKRSASHAVKSSPLRRGVPLPPFTQLPAGSARGGEPIVSFDWRRNSARRSAFATSRTVSHMIALAGRGAVKERQIGLRRLPDRP
jgi:hypothetical protein